MLWSLTKVILFVVVIAALALGAGLLSETGEAMRIVVVVMVKPSWDRRDAAF